MKKRWLAVLLTVAMCLSLLPAVAMAEEAAESETPQLWWAKLNSSSGIYSLRDSNYWALSQIDTACGENPRFALYYGTENGEKQPVTQITSDTEDVVSVENLNGANEEKNFFRLRCKAFGTVNLSCVIDENTSVSWNVTVGLPTSAAWYSTQERRQETYICDQADYDPTNGITLWVLREGGFDETGDFTAVLKTGDEVLATYPVTKVALADSGNNFDLKVVIPAGLELDPDGSKLQICYNYNLDDEQQYTDIKLVPPEEVQLWRVNLSSSNGVYSESNPGNYQTFSSMNFVSGNSFNRGLYYGTESNAKQRVTSVVSNNEDIISIKTLTGANGETNFFRLSCESFGEVVLTFTMEDGSTYTETVTVDIPACGLFSQQAYEKQYYLEDINLLALQDNAVWLIHKEGFSAEVSQQISAEWLCEYDDTYSPEIEPTVTVVERNDDSGRYDIKITLPVANASCQLQVTGPDIDERWWVEVAGTSVQIGDYLIGYGSMEGDENNGFLTIEKNHRQRNTNSESTSDARSGLGEWAIYAGTPTDQESVYDPAPEVGIQLNKVWVEVLEGENALLSWDDAVEPVVTELTTFEGNICGRLYRLNGKEGLGVVYSNITVTIDGESSTHTIASAIILEQVASSSSERPEDDTVAALNEYLQKLKEQEDDPEAEEDAHYEIYLADTTYEGEIIVPAYEKGTLFIYGAFGQGTILEGCITMEEGANIHKLYDIAFRATEEHSDYAITGGSGTIVDCSFYGYDVAIKSGQNFIRVAGNCAFVNNGIGYLHDSTEDYRNAYGDASFEECVFINNGTAISLQNWGNRDPDPFNFRAYNSNFIGNDVDFDVQVAGTFYFQANYFGYLVEEVSDEELLNWLDSRQLTNINEARRAAVVTAGADASVITSPRWRNALDDMWWFKNDLSMDLYSLRTAETETEEENELICDWETTTQIVNSEAGDLLIDDSAFDIDGDQVIYVVDDEEEPVVTWDFN